MKAFILLFLISFIYSFSFTFENKANNDCFDSFLMERAKTNKPAAFAVLNEKCNVCHEAKKRVVFTLGNMETHAGDIHQQVFIKKRMPKGKKFPLTEQESTTLKNWLATLRIP